jgi:hypothetical protein
VESGEWRVESGEWRVESGEWRVESGVEKLRQDSPFSILRIGLPDLHESRQMSHRPASCRLL